MQNEINDNCEITIDSAKAKKLWIHCNKCYKHFIEPSTVLFLLACQHVICEKCVTASLGRTPGDAPTYTCPMCHKKVRGRQVNNALPPNLKHLFHPEPWHDGLPHVLIGSFQKANQKNLDAYIAIKEKEELKLNKDMQMAHSLCQKQYLELQRLRMSRKQLEVRARKIKNQVQIYKEEKRRLSIKRRRSESSGSLMSGNKYSLQESKHSRARPQSVETVVRPKTETISLLSESNTKPAITSFRYNNNHSFVL